MSLKTQAKIPPFLQNHQNYFQMLENKGKKMLKDLSNMWSKCDPNNQKTYYELIKNYDPNTYSFTKPAPNPVAIINNRNQQSKSTT
jgi:hypothetical protein